MYSNEIRNQFIERRAREESLAGIAAAIGISKRTALDWNQQFKEEIKRLRALEREALEHEILASYKDDLTRLMRFKKRLEEILIDRDFRGTSTEGLLRFYLQFRRHINDSLEDLSCLDQALPATPQQPAAPAQPLETPPPAAPTPEPQAASPSPAPPPATPESPDQSPPQKLAA